MFIYLLNNIQKIDENFAADETAFFVEGLLNKQSVSLIPKTVKTIIINDLSSVFLSYVELKNLQNKFDIYYSQKYSLKNFVINIKDVDKQTLIDKLNEKENFNTDLLIFNPYAVV